MMLLEVDLAIYKRLSGAPLDDRGRPMTDGAGIPINRERIGPPDLLPYERVYDAGTKTSTAVLPTLPSYGVRVPLTKGPVSRQGLTSYNQDGLPVFDKFEPYSFRQVPVFDQNMTGRKIDDVWPCVTFRWMGMDFDPKVFVYHDPFGSQDEESPAVNILNRSGTVIQSGFAKNLRRPHPEAWTMTYVITAHAKSAVELALICTEIVRLFPARGALNVTLANGELHAWDMLLQRTETMDEGGNEVLMTRGGEEQRSFARAFVYTVESYMDNTVNKYGSQDTREYVAIRERLLELDRLQDGVLRAQESNEDANLGELSPITT